MKPYPLRPLEPIDSSKVFLAYFTETTRQLIDGKLQLDEDKTLIFEKEGDGYDAYITSAFSEENMKMQRLNQELLLQQYYIDMAEYNIQFNERQKEYHKREIERLNRVII